MRGVHAMFIIIIITMNMNMLNNAQLLANFYFYVSQMLNIDSCDAVHQISYIAI